MTRSIFALLILFFTASSTQAANGLIRFRDSLGVTYTCMTPAVYTRTVATLADGQACSYKTRELEGIIGEYARIDTLNRSSIEACLASRDTVQASLGTVTRAYEEQKLRSTFEKWLMFAAGAGGAIAVIMLGHLVP